MIADYVYPRYCWKCMKEDAPDIAECVACKKAHTEVAKIISTKVGGGDKTLIEILGEFRVVPTFTLRNFREEVKSD